MSDPARSRVVRAGRALVRFGASALTVLVVVLLTARWSNSTAHLAIAVATLTPYLLLPAAAASLALWFAGARVRAALALIVTLIVLGTQLPALVPSFDPQYRPGLTVMTANLHLGGADPESVARAISSNGVDVAMLEEVTPGQLRGLRSAGVRALLPYAVDSSKPGARGVVLLSRYRLSDVGVDNKFFLGLVHARLDIAGHSGPTVAALHVSGPYPQSATGWRDDLRRLGPTLHRLSSDAPGGFVAAGDFNATTDNAPFRALLGHGLRDAGDLSAQPLVTTYPADSAIPPVIDIDHVLTDAPAARDLRTVRIPGSDHRALIADIDDQHR